MRCLSIDFNPGSAGELDAACNLLVKTLKKRRVKVSVPPLLTLETPTAKVITRGAYSFRCVEKYDVREDKVCGRLDALYGKQVAIPRPDLQ